MLRSLVVLGLLLFASVCCFAESVSVTSDFGWRMHPIYGYEKFHTGVDLGYSYGSPVGALDAGTVVLADWYGGYGNCVIVQHDNGDSTLYGHLARIMAEPGERVEAGHLIGYSGSTGVSTGPHLHVEWWHDGQYCDPLPLFANGGLLDSAVPVSSGVSIAGKQLILASEKKEPGWFESQVAFQFDSVRRQQEALEKQKAEPVQQKVQAVAAPVGYTVAQEQQIEYAERLEKTRMKRKDSISFDGSRSVGFNI